MVIQSDQPLLSVVIPVYNGEKFMRGCMDSVAAAVAALAEGDRAQVEVVLCDNHSTDRTREMVEAVPLFCAFRVVQPPVFCENRTENWHHGLSQARGVWMMMLHADDLLAPDGLLSLLLACRRSQNSRFALVSGRHRTFKDDTSPGRIRPIWPLPAVLGGEALRRRVLPYFCPFVPFTTMRRDLYERVGGLDAAYELVQDWDLWIRLLAHGDCFYFPREVGYWRTHPLSERYATTFAREHMLLAFRMAELVPGLSAAEQAQTVRSHVARARLLRPTDAPETLLADT